MSGLRLRTLGMLWTLAAFVCGLAAAACWFLSTAAWQGHLAEAERIGTALYDTLRTGAPPPEGITRRALGPEEANAANGGAFAGIGGLGQPVLVTLVSIQAAALPDAPVTGPILSGAILSRDLRYPIADLGASDLGEAAKLGAITRLLATYCSAPVLVLRHGGGTWWEVRGDTVWGCAAQPGDFRLLAILLSIIALAILLSKVAETAALFQRFAEALARRGRLGGPEAYDAEGPLELRELVAAVNASLQAERAALARRAAMLSGISHDLGTPATRLRLRTVLIEDEALRAKIEADIDRMTGMIESVLTYTRSELSAEPPANISLTALVQAVVDDFRDLGYPVTFRETDPVVLETAGTVFLSAPGRGTVPQMRRKLVRARPVSVQRAVSNLVDNAIKYGRRATVGVETDATTATVWVEDEGGATDPEAVERLVAPFQRGQGGPDGYGLGLSIVATIAEQHGGSLRFERGVSGLRAVLTLARVSGPEPEEVPRSA